MKFSSHSSTLSIWGGVEHISFPPVDRPSIVSSGWKKNPVRSERAADRTEPTRSSREPIPEITLLGNSIDEESINHIALSVTLYTWWGQGHSHHGIHRCFGGIWRCWFKTRTCYAFSYYPVVFFISSLCYRSDVMRALRVRCTLHEYVHILATWASTRAYATSDCIFKYVYV